MLMPSRFKLNFPSIISHVCHFRVQLTSKTGIRMFGVQINEVLLYSQKCIEPIEAWGIFHGRMYSITDIITN